MYTFNVTLKQPFAEAIETVLAALQAEKFGVVSDVNVQGILKNKLDVEYPGYRLLGACQPSLAKQIADADPDAGALLPCNVLVREDPNGDTVVAFMDPVPVLGLSDSEEVHRLADVAKARLLKVRDRLAA